MLDGRNKKQKVKKKLSVYSLKTKKTTSYENHYGNRQASVKVLNSRMNCTSTTG